MFQFKDQEGGLETSFKTNMIFPVTNFRVEYCLTILTPAPPAVLAYLFLYYLVYRQSVDFIQ